MFKSNLELVDTRRKLATAIIADVLGERRSNDVESLQATLSLVEDGERILQELNSSRVKAVAGAKALARANERWEQLVAAACSRLLAGHLRPRAAEHVIDKIAAELEQPAAKLRTWLRDHEGDRNSDGPQPAADAAIAALLRVHPRSVRRWRTERGATLFGRLLQIEADHEAPPRTGLISSFVEFLDAHGDAASSNQPIVQGMLGAAIEPMDTGKNKP